MAIFGRKENDRAATEPPQNEDQDETDALKKRLQAAERQASVLAKQLKESERVRELAETEHRNAAADAAKSYRKLKILMDDLMIERQRNAQSKEALVDKQLAMAELKSALSHKQEQLDQLLRDLTAAPAMTPQTRHLLQLQTEILDQLYSTLSCAMCFEPIGKGQIISLACGHVFCSPCIDRWAEASVENQKHSLPEYLQGPVRAECPECRGDASKSGRIKIYVLEEIVRALAKYDPSVVLELSTPAPAQTAEEREESDRAEKGNTMEVEE